MHASRRQSYLKALEIETWTRRDASPPPDSQRAEPAPVELKPAEPKPAAVRPLLDWSELRQKVAACNDCRLRAGCTQTVFGVGPETAPLMVVGEGPGADEDAKGEPFVGRAGKLLDEMLKAIGRSRTSDTYIANVVKCRPPDNRNPAEDEAEACRGYLERQLQLVQPKLIVALGAVAAKLLLQTETPVGKLRGAIHAWGPDKTPLMVTYHPAYLLRSPGEKAKSWEDLKKVHRFLNP